MNTIDSIPEHLYILDVLYTGLSYIPELPDSLVHLDASFNNLTELPELPQFLTHLQITGNPIDSLFLNDGIEYIGANDCELVHISSPIPNCTDFRVDGNNLTSLPLMPDTLDSFNIADNQIECLNYFPTFVYFPGILAFDISSNPFTCVPNYPQSPFSTLIYPDEYPLCSNDDPINNPYGCEGANGFEGYVHIDQDNQCDYNESALVNIPIKIGLNGQGLTITNSLSNGRYLYQGEYGDYQIALDEINVPFINNCGSQEVTINNANPYNTDLNFALECEYENDFGIQSVLTDGWVFPGQFHETKVFAGELSQFYNASCSSSSGGEVLITLEGPAIITGVPTGAPEPSAFTDSSISFNVDDFTAIDLMDYFELEIYTQTTATDEEEICLTIQVVSVSSDPVLENNYLNFCYPVVNSYDPNNKLVSPATAEPGYDD